MGYVTLKFLGKEYQVSETVNEFLHYDELLTPMRSKIIQTLSRDVKKDAIGLTFGDHMPDYMMRNVGVYQKLMKDCADVLVNKLFALGIYDVTADNLLETTTAIADVKELGMASLQNMLSEGRRFVEMQNAGIERAYRSAASNITGSGLMVFTSSIATLMLHSVVDREITMSQAKQADREYEEAVRAINASTRRGLDKMVSEVMVKQYYPAVMDILMQFNLKITSAFLVELAQHNKFDFASIEKYNMQKAEQMLTNISRVPDKVEFLQQIFDVCPFSLELYDMCLTQELLDIETFETAEYFGFAANLVGKMDEYLQKHLQNKKSIEPIIAILAKYRKTDELAIWRTIYHDTIFRIENTYKSFNLAIERQSDLDRFVRQFIDPSAANVARKNEADISKLVGKAVGSVVSQERYSEFIEMGLLHPENIRVTNSFSVELSQINAEIINELTVVTMAYVEEASRRLKLYEESKAALIEAIKTMQSEIDRLKVEKERLGFFAFSKKKELSLLIEQKEKEISAYEKTHESKRLWNELEKMYRQ